MIRGAKVRGDGGHERRHSSGIESLELQKCTAREDWSELRRPKAQFRQRLTNSKALGKPYGSQYRPSFVATKFQWVFEGLAGVLEERLALIRRLGVHWCHSVQE